MKKLLLFILVFAITLPNLAACSEKNRDYDEGEVWDAALSLIKKSEILNDVYWGEGLGYSEETSLKNGYYYSVTPAELSRIGIKSVEELKIKTLEVFSLRYSENIFETLLSALGDEDTGIVGYTRYFQDEENVMVYSKYNVLLVDDVTYLYDTLKVTGSEGDVVFVTIDLKIKRDEAEQIRNIKVGLFEELNGWRIDTPTYAVYAEGIT